jgi:hypothetical protein
MRKKLMIGAATLLAALCMFAADATGKWTAQSEGRGGRTMTTTFNLKADGSTLTGTVEGGRGGPVDISNGKIDGDTITFDVTRSTPRGDFTLNYKGKVSDDSIEFDVTTPMGTRKMTAKKSTT